MDASVTWGNAPRTDVLAQRLDPSRLAAIQVKTRTSGDFQVGKGAEEPSPPGSDEWYVLVGLGEVGTRPDFFIVPRDHMSALVGEGPAGHYEPPCGVWAHPRSPGVLHARFRGP